MLRRLLFALAALAALTGCSNMKPEQFAGTEPALKLEEYFLGHTRAYGIVEDRFGNLRRSFVAEIQGSWDGTVLTLVEDFDWSDGEKQQRIWKLTRLDEHRWEGTAGDVIGKSAGVVYGNAFNMQYYLDLQLDGRRLKVHFDDWMWLQRDGVLINRAVMSKWGFDLATITISFRRLAPDEVKPAQAAQAAE
ncbi:MAG: hypothetical protein RLY86_579 [Pseudomonadota bacterium]|jgi:hypothetical protein